MKQHQRLALLIGLLAAAAGCGSSSQKNRPRFGDLYEVIDCHVHLPSRSGRLWTWHPVINDVETYIRYLKECGVEIIMGTGGVDKRSGRLLLLN